jgi:hypothetical protein
VTHVWGTSYRAIPTVLELGAGCALPSLLAATGRFPTSPQTQLSHTGTLHPHSSSHSHSPPTLSPEGDDDDNAPALVIVTDFPDPSILSTLQQNVTQNRRHFAPRCDVRWAGYEWGESVEGLLYVFLVYPFPPSPTCLLLFSATQIDWRTQIPPSSSYITKQRRRKAGI